MEDAVRICPAQLKQRLRKNSVPGNPGLFRFVGLLVDGRASRRAAAQPAASRTTSAATRGSARERPAHTRDGRLDVLDDQRRIEPEHAVARASRHRIPTRIRPSALSVVPATKFDDEPLGRRPNSQR